MVLSVIWKKMLNKDNIGLNLKTFKHSAFKLTMFSFLAILFKWQMLLTRPDNFDHVVQGLTNIRWIFVDEEFINYILYFLRNPIFINFFILVSLLSQILYF